MRALTGCAHAGYAALHVREMLSHGDSDPLHQSAISVSVARAPRRGPGQGVGRVRTGCLGSPSRRGDEETVASAATLSGDFCPTPLMLCWA